MLDNVVLLLNKVCVSLPDNIGTLLVLLVSEDRLSLLLVNAMVDE